MSSVFPSNSFGWQYCGIVTRYVPNPQFLICQIDLIGEPTDVMCTCALATSLVVLLGVFQMDGLRVKLLRATALIVLSGGS